MKIAISRTPTVTRGTRRYAADLRTVARSYAPKRTGKGARSITINRTTTPQGVTGFKVSWTKDRFYMLFQEEGTDHGIVGKHFLLRAARVIEARGGR